ncbi:MAG: cation:proton antiporter [Gammaproteobacteria bacterium]|nr:cation:proton antiporter [Gammaproteobacteria bacterium]
MEPHSILLLIAIMLIAARLFAEAARRFNIPPIIGELFAGILVGPSLLGWIEPNAILRLLAEIGIILLLFEVGLETDLGRLVKAGPRAAVLALAGFVLPFLFSFGLSHYLFDLSLLVSLFIGGTLTATSIGITVRILADLGRHRGYEAQIVLGAAVLDDILGVILLAVLYEFATEKSISIDNVGRITLLIMLFLILAPIVAKVLSVLLKHYHGLSETPGLIPVLLMAMILLFASAAHSMGAPLLIGGFAAGLALSRRFFLPFGAALRTDPDFTQHVHKEMKPIIHLFTPLFFIMVGVSLDLSTVDWGSAFIWTFSLSLAVVAILGKVIGGWLLPEPFYRRTLIGMAMVPRGEVGLIFAELGRVAGVLNNEVYAALVIVIAYTTLFSPFWIKAYYRRYARHFEQPQDGL